MTWITTNCTRKLNCLDDNQSELLPRKSQLGSVWEARRGEMPPDQWSVNRTFVRLRKTRRASRSSQLRRKLGIGFRVARLLYLDSEGIGFHRFALLIFRSRGYQDTCRAPNGCQLTVRC